MAVPRWVGRTAIAIAALLLGVLVLRGSCSGYDSRRYVNEALGESVALKARVADFHDKHRRLPATADAMALAPGTARNARDIRWDAPQRSVVVTMGRPPYEGKRFALAAEVRDGRLAWTCRPIDIEPKYLPADCR